MIGWLAAGLMIVVAQDPGATKLELREERSFVLEDAGARSAAYGPTPEHLASGGEFGDVVVWNGKVPKWRFDAGDAPVTAVAFDAKGERVAALGVDVVILDANTGALLRRLSAYRSGAIAWSADGRWFAHSFGARMAIVRSAEDFAVVHRLPVDSQGPIGALAFSPDGAKLAVGNASGSLVTFAVESGEAIGAADHGEAIDGLRWEGGEPRVQGTGPLTADLDGPHPHGAVVRSVSFSRDGLTLIAATHRSLFVAACEGDEAPRRIPGTGLVAPGATGGEFWVVATKRVSRLPVPGESKGATEDGEVVPGGGYVARLRSAREVLRTVELPLIDGEPELASTSPDGRWLAVWGRACGGALVDLQSGDGTPFVGDALGFGWSDDSARLIKVGGARVQPGKGERPMGHLQVFATSTRRAKESLLRWPAHAAVFVGEDIVFATPGRTLHRIEVESREQLDTLDARVEWLAVLDAGTVLSHDGVRLAVRAADDLAVVREIPMGRIDHAVLSPDRRRLALVDRWRVRVFAVER